MKNILLVLVVIFFSSKDNTSTAADMGVERITNTLESKPEITIDNSLFMKSALYKGALNGTIKIWLYLNEQEHPCGGDLTILNVMYKYDTQEKWILLNVTTDSQKMKYCMVEDNFSGVLFLEKNDSSLNGKWISPDVTKQFEVVLEKQAIDKILIEKLDEILFDDLIYSKNDC